MNREILCTVGPASMKKTVLERFDDLPVTLLRINLSHTPINKLEECIQFIQNNSKKPICIDTEGAQIRTHKMVEGRIQILENRIIKIHRTKVPGDSQNISFYPPESFDLLRVFDLISIDFNAALVQVIDKTSDYLLARVITEGWVGSNKAVSVNRTIKLNPLTQKDRDSIKIALKYKIKHFALSFANHVDNVRELRGLTEKDSFIISKIESHAGLENLEPIASESDAILIDRGDLSREEPIESIPLLQKHIIRTAKNLKTKVYVATNLLESMLTHPKPTRAEVNDVLNTLIDGADGLVLAAETAIGENPIGCVNMISQLIHQYENYSKHGIQTQKYDRRSLLIEPHGGCLVNQMMDNPDWTEIGKLPSLVVDEKTVLDCEQIATGVYSPLRGFMTKEEMESVLDNNRLPDGNSWTLPIILQTRKTLVAKLACGDNLALIDNRTNKPFAILNVSDVSPLDFESTTKRWFGTSSTQHPGVKQIEQGGDMMIGGKIHLLQHSEKPGIAPYLISPVNTRMIFEQKNWYRIVGFHTRNIIHRAHEYIQIKSLNDYHCDGLFISPVVGPKKNNDSASEVVLKAYDIMLNYGFYPKNKALIGAFSTYPRYAGPREAVFTALCRKNFGCTHFIVGRDHTGVQNFYSPDASQKYFEKVDHIGIIPLFYDAVSYCTQCKDYRTLCDHGKESIQEISGSRVTQQLMRGEELPGWLVREEIAEMLYEIQRSKQPLFIGQ